jgi:formamidopyrimidine-DNA glycosylase
MPELPEVEEVRRTLEPFVLGHQITAVRVHRADFVSPSAEAIAGLVGRRFTRTIRHGKKLFCVADDDQTVVIHLGMSGRVDCVAAETPLLKHTHVVIELASGTTVRLRDPRRFGGLGHYPTFEQATARETKSLGKDALALKPADLGHWRKSRGRLKQRLLSQRDVAGLGNIYVDETLWLVKLHPRQLVSHITPGDVARLVAAMQKVLCKSIASGGTTLRDYRNVSDQPGRFALELRAYGRGGKPCARCKTALKSVQIAARSTVFCPHCQRCR